jgi:hypothetical protein
MAEFEHAVNQPGEQMGRGRDRLGSTEFGAEAAELGAQRALAPQQSPGCQPQGGRGPVHHLPCTAFQHLVPADPVS